MTITIDFYLLTEPSFEATLRPLCHLVEQHYQPDARIYIHTPSRTITQQLDDLLWTFHDISFLPHASIDNNPNDVPILLGDANTANPSGNLLINLTSTVPNFYANFKKILEIVPSEDLAKAEARKRYKFYKSLGYVLNTRTGQQT